VTGALARADRAVLRVLRTRLHGRALERSAIVYTSVGEFGANYLVKIAVWRRRAQLAGLPPLGHAPATFSFPSGHAAR
jgi:membrane-associated phospholipid phosphatase